MELREFGPDDEASIAAYVAIENACLVDAPWWHPSTVFRQTMRMRHGWDGEVGRYFLVHVDGEDEAVGRAAVHTSEYDNLDLAWVELAIRPELPAPRVRHAGAAADLRRRAVDGPDQGRAGSAGWGSRPRGSRRRWASNPSRSPSTAASTSRELEPGLADRLYAEAEPHARDYELLRIVAPDAGGAAAGPRRGHRRHQRRAAGRHRDGGRGVHAGAGPRLRAAPSSPAASASTGSSPGTAPPASWRACRSSPSTAQDPRHRRTSTTPRSSAATVGTGSGSCSRPT